MVTDINTSIIISSATEINKRCAVLKWLDQYGEHLADRNNYRLTVDIRYAGSVNGVEETEAALAESIEAEMMTIVQLTRERCLAEIAYHKDRIKTSIVEEHDDRRDS